MKKLISILVAVIMCCMLIPSAAFASSTYTLTFSMPEGVQVQYGGGSGTPKFVNGESVTVEAGTKVMLYAQVNATNLAFVDMTRSDGGSVSNGGSICRVFDMPAHNVTVTVIVKVDNSLKGSASIIGDDFAGSTKSLSLRNMNSTNLSYKWYFNESEVLSTSDSYVPTTTGLLCCDITASDKEGTIHAEKRIYVNNFKTITVSAPSGVSVEFNNSNTLSNGESISLLVGKKLTFVVYTSGSDDVVKSVTRSDGGMIHIGGSILKYFDMPDENISLIVTLESSSHNIAVSSTVSSVTGGGDYSDGESVTITAQNVKGYTFDGWYFKGSKVSSSLSYTFTASDATEGSYEAKYTVKPTVMHTLTVSASKFKYSLDSGSTWSANQKSSLSKSLEADTRIKVRFVGGADEEFRYWINGSNRVISTSEDIDITLATDNNIRAIYNDTAEGEALVVFLTYYNQVLSTESYALGATSIDFPTAPGKMGATFIGWDKTEAEIISQIATKRFITVKPVYEAGTEKYTATVKYQGVSKADETYQDSIGNPTLLSATPVISGKNFSYWKDSHGNILSTTNLLRIRPSKNETYTAVYGEAVEVRPIITLTDAYAEPNGTKYKLSFAATRSIPSDYTIVEHGILFTTNSSVASDMSKFVIGGSDVKANSTSDDASVLNAVYTLNLNTTDPSRNVYTRAYVIVMDGVGSSSIIYSENTLGGCYNSIVE